MGVHAARSKAFRQLAESKKVHPQKGTTNEVVEEIEDPMHGLAAEWAIEEADAALKWDKASYTAAWEGAIAAKHIGWWHKGRAFAKLAMEACGDARGVVIAERRQQREAASTLSLLFAEEEQAETQRKIREVRMLRQKEVEVEANTKEVDWAMGVVSQLNDALKPEEFKRPHYQLWKMLSPNLEETDQQEIKEEMRRMVWDRWNHLAWKEGYRSSDTSRAQLCARLVNIANSGRASEVKKLIREIEDRVCIAWQDIPAARKDPRHDEMWAYHRREDGSWGNWQAGTTM